MDNADIFDDAKIAFDDVKKVAFDDDVREDIREAVCVDDVYECKSATPFMTFKGKVLKADSQVNYEHDPSIYETFEQYYINHKWCAVTIVVAALATLYFTRRLCSHPHF